MVQDTFTTVGAYELLNWPITMRGTLFSSTINEIHMALDCLPDGSFGLSVTRNGNTEEYETDVIVPNGIFKFVLTIVYEPTQVKFRLNRKNVGIGLLGIREKGIFHFDSKSKTYINELPTTSTITPSTASEPEALFIRVLNELSEASCSDDWYILLKSSANLRLLLLDGFLNKINKKYNLSLEFKVAAYSRPPGDNPYKIFHPISANGIPPENVNCIKLNKFLKHLIFESNSGSFTVKDVIRAAANADGGVHFGNPKYPQEELILSLDKGGTNVFNQSISRHLLKKICLVTVEGLQPLAKKIQEEK